MISAFAMDQIAGFAWAMAVLEYQNAPLLAAIASQSRRTITELEHGELSSTPWAYAYLRFMPVPLINALSSASIPRIRHIATLSIANLAWSIAVMEVGDGPWIHALAAQSIRMLSEFGMLQRSAMAWAISACTVFDFPLLHALSSEASARCSELEKTNLAATAWACAMMVYEPVPLLHAIAAAARATRNEYRPKEFVTLARALWGLQFWPPPECDGCLPLPPPDPALLAGTTPLPAAALPKTPEARPDLLLEHELARRGYVLRMTAGGHPGDGRTFPRPGGRVEIAYVGRVLVAGSAKGGDGPPPFDAAECFEFVVGAGSVIAGWEKGVAAMSLGQEARLLVHRSHGYGSLGAPAPGAWIPPHADLIFEVTLLRVDSPAPAALLPGAAAGHLAAERREALLCYADCLSVDTWLLAIDERGTLLEYSERLARDYDNARQIVGVYTKAWPDGSASLEPEFFDELGVSRLGHRRLFEQWFEGWGVVRAPHRKARSANG